MGDHDLSDLNRLEREKAGIGSEVRMSHWRGVTMPVVPASTCTAAMMRKQPSILPFFDRGCCAAK